MGHCLISELILILHRARRGKPYLFHCKLLWTCLRKELCGRHCGRRKSHCPPSCGPAEGVRNQLKMINCIHTNLARLRLLTHTREREVLVYKICDIIRNCLMRAVYASGYDGEVFVRDDRNCIY